MATHSKTDHAVKRKRRLGRRRREAELRKARLAAAGTPEKPNPRRWQGYARQGRLAITAAKLRESGEPPGDFPSEAGLLATSRSTV